MSDFANLGVKALLSVGVTSPKNGVETGVHGPAVHPCFYSGLM